MNVTRGADHKKSTNVIIITVVNFSIMDRWRKNLDVYIFNVILAVLISATISYTIALYRNTLSLHPEWISTRTTLGKCVMGALSFVNRQQSLARKYLNLVAWHGYQEVTYRDAVDPSALELGRAIYENVLLLAISRLRAKDAELDVFKSELSISPYCGEPEAGPAMTLCAVAGEGATSLQVGNMFTNSPNS